MEGKKMENILLDLEPIENVLMESLKSLHREREFNYTLDLLHSQFVHTVHDLEQLHKDKIAWYLLHLPNVLKVELVNTLIKRDIRNKEIEHESEVAHEKRVAASKYDWSSKQHGHVKPNKTVGSDGSTSSTESSYSTDSDWVTSYSHADKCFFYYNKITGESTWECPDLSKHYEFVDWKIPEVQETVDSEYESPHSPVPVNKLQDKHHHHQHNHHLHTHINGKPTVCDDSSSDGRYVDTKVHGKPTVCDDSSSDIAVSEPESIETRQSTLVDENYHPKKQIHHPSLTLLERMRSLKRYTFGKWNE